MDTIERSPSSRSVKASPDAVLHAHERRLTVEEYRAMGEAGIFSEDDRIELLDGRLIAMPPIGPSHGHGVDDLDELFARRVYLPDATLARVRVQGAIQLGEFGEPEPDLTLYDPDVPRERHPRPDDIFLVVEVADSSIEYDRNVKSQQYGEAGIPEYWVVDLDREAVDVFRRPEADGYAERIRHRSGDELTVSTLADLEPLPVAAILGESEE